MDEFDKLLYQGAAQLPPDAARPSPEPPRPWKKPMDRVCLGLALITVTLDFLYLDVILPAVGTVLLWLGLRALRRENGAFRFAYICATLYAALRFAGIVALATPLDHWLAEAVGTEWQTLTGAVPLHAVVRAGVLQLLLALAAAGLWRGLKGVFRKAGQPPKAGSAGAAAIMVFLLFPLACVGLTGWLLVGPLLLIWALLLRSLFKLSRSLDEAGYALSPAPARVSDGGAAALWLCTALAAVIILPLCFARLPVRAETPVYGPSDGQSSLRARLTELGFPEDLLAELSDGDVARFEGAYGVTMKGYRGSGNYPDGIPDITLAEVPVADETYGFRMVYLARLEWDCMDDSHLHFYTEGLRVQPDYHGAFASLDCMEGRLEWEEDGVFHTAPLDLRVNGWLDYTADFSLPAHPDGGRVTGWLFWSGVPSRPTVPYIFNASITCAHRITPWVYPYELASDGVLQNGPGALFPPRNWRTFQDVITCHAAPEGEYTAIG